MPPHRDRIRWIPPRREILQEVSVFGCCPEPTVDEEEGRFGCVIAGWCGTKELDVSSGSGYMSAGYGGVECDGKPEVFPG